MSQASKSTQQLGYDDYDSDSEDMEIESSSSSSSSSSAASAASSASSSASEEKTVQQINREQEEVTLFRKYPTNDNEYESMEYNLIQTYFTRVDCRKIVRTLDILHRTFQTSLTKKKDAKVVTHMPSLLNNTTLINYLTNIAEDDENASLHRFLFDDEGNGIIIWAHIDDKLTLAQLVNPLQNEERFDALPRRTTGKKRGGLTIKWEKKLKNNELTLGANNWMRNTSSSSSSAAASSKSDNPFNNITITQFLKNIEEEEEWVLIFDALTKTQGDQMSFSLTAGEIQINSSKNADALILVDNTTNPVFKIENIPHYFANDFFKVVRFLPFFQSYNRDLKTGNYKVHGELENQKNWLEQNPGGAITPIRDEKMCCALCGKELAKKKNQDYKYDVDHVWNLILNSLLNILDDSEGYFDTHDDCNRTFKSDKVFTPNIGLWAKMAAFGFGVHQHGYVWPGKKFADIGKVNRTFNIGYLTDEFRESAYKLDLPQDNEKKRQKALLKYELNEGLNHKDVWKIAGKPLFNEFELQLKFLKRTLKIANNLDVGDATVGTTPAQLAVMDGGIINSLIQSFNDEISLLSVAAEKMEILTALRDNNFSILPDTIKGWLKSVKAWGAQEQAKKKLKERMQQGPHMEKAYSTASRINDKSKDDASVVRMIAVPEYDTSLGALEQVRKNLNLFLDYGPEGGRLRNGISHHRLGVIRDGFSAISAKLENPDEGTDEFEKKKWIVMSKPNNSKDGIITLINKILEIKRNALYSSKYASVSPGKEKVEKGAAAMSPGEMRNGSPITRNLLKEIEKAKTPGKRRKRKKRSDAGAGAAEEEYNQQGKQQQKKRSNRKGGTRRYKKKKKKKKTKRRNKKRRKKTKRKRKQRKRTRRKR
jgi:hypothetical protein